MAIGTDLENLLIPFVLLVSFFLVTGLVAGQELRSSRPSGTHRRTKRRKRQLRLTCCDLSRLSRLLNRRTRNDRPSQPLQKTSP